MAVARYYFAGRRNQSPIAPWVAPYLVLATVLVVALPSVGLALAVFAPAGLLIAMRMLRTREGAASTFYDEPAEDRLIVNIVTTNEIPYEVIESAELPRFQVSEPLRPLVIVSNLLSRAFGGAGFPDGRKGEIDRDSVELRFKCRIWLSVAFPPFLLPKTSWRLHLEDAPSLQMELAKRLRGDLSEESGPQSVAPA